MAGRWFATRALRREFVTGDGVRLSYLEAGEGPPLVLLHGWSQAAVMWHAQIEAFRATHRVIALDMRGHGASSRPDHGYRIARLAGDLAELMEALDLKDAVLMGHSLGCSVILNLWDVFGSHRTAGLVLFDEGVSLCVDGSMSSEERQKFGAQLPADAWFDIASQLRGSEAEAMTRRIITGMFTPRADPTLVEAVIALNLALPRRYAAQLLLSNVFQDWRDIFRRITVPTLVIGAEASVMPITTMAWQADTIPDARLAVIAAEDGGSHFAFLENPRAFNAIVADFLKV